MNKYSDLGRLSENVHGFYWYYCSLAVKASIVGTASVVKTGSDVSPSSFLLLHLCFILFTISPHLCCLLSTADFILGDSYIFMCTYRY